MSLTYKQVYDALPKDLFDKIVEIKREKTRMERLLPNFLNYSQEMIKICLETTNIGGMLSVCRIFKDIV
jgi:hypothetical protein